EWEAYKPQESGGPEVYVYLLTPTDSRRRFIQWLSAAPEHDAKLGITISAESTDEMAENEQDVQVVPIVGRVKVAGKWKSFPRSKVVGYAVYNRSNVPAFNRTYRQICNSLQVVESP